MQANRNGFFYVIDRTSGKLISGTQFARKVNWASGIDIASGRPIDTPMTAMVRKTEEMKDFIEVWPSAFGGKNWMPMSYDPGRKLVFLNSIDLGMKVKYVKQERPGGPNWYLGLELGGFVDPADGNRGALVAWDPVAGKAVWTVRNKSPFWAGVLSTASRRGLHRFADRPVHGLRREDRQEAVVVPDRLGHLRPADRLGEERPRVHHRAERLGARLRRARRRPRHWPTCRPAARCGPSRCLRHDERSAGRLHSSSRSPPPRRRRARRRPRPTRPKPGASSTSARASAATASTSPPTASASTCAPSRRTTRSASCAR